MSTCHLRTVLVRSFTTCMHAALECMLLVIVPGSCKSVLRQGLMRACVLPPVMSTLSISCLKPVCGINLLALQSGCGQRATAMFRVIELQHHLHSLLPNHAAYKQKLFCYIATG